MIYSATQLTDSYMILAFNKSDCSSYYNNIHEVTPRVPSLLRITDKFGYISPSHFFSALTIGSVRLETSEALYLLFHWTVFSLKWRQFTVSWYIVLTYFRRTTHLYTPGKYHKTRGFLINVKERARPTACKTKDKSYIL